MPLAAIIAIVGLGSSALTALITNFLAPLFRDRFIEQWRARRVAKEDSLKLVYEPLYKSLMATPSFPGGTIEDLGHEILIFELKAVEKIVSENSRHAHKDLRERTLGWADLYFYKNEEALGGEWRWLWKHVDERFERLRSHLGHE